ncbi:hypothetical protein [Luteibacter yeojuensis]|uniref:Uncharacterized protein n=1 Tax=Luteibacter yeojuensis TaxID=345309 RepID=A0A7X5TS12_9GAMM|nr:hypothetical protein [Luteibacter yeojuensis]NID16997.1 hypothetical protein [Luteibacter yeojuensis]
MRQIMKEGHAESPSAQRRAAWYIALTLAGVAGISPVAHADTTTEIRLADPCVLTKPPESDETPTILLTREAIRQRLAAAAVKERLVKYFEKMPTSMKCEWWKAFDAHSNAERLLFDQVEKERKALEFQAFSDIATRLGVPTIVDLYLHTDLVDEQGAILKRSHVIEPLTDFIRRGVDFGLRRRATKNGRDYIKYTRVNRFASYSPHFNQDIDFKKVIDVLTDYDAAGRIQDSINSRFSDKTSPWSTPAAIMDAAKAELRFAGLEALRKGDITLEQYGRFTAAIEADKGDGQGELSYAHYALRVGRTWFSGSAPHPIQLPAFNIRLRSTWNSTRTTLLPETNFLYTPGHPDGSLRILPVGGSAASMIIGNLESAGSAENRPGHDKSHKVLAWLGRRLPPLDFHELLGELTKGDSAGKTVNATTMPIAGGRLRNKRALAEKTESDSNALTQWLAGRLQAVFGDKGPTNPRVGLERYPTGNRPLRFVDAVAASQLSRARSAMDPRFVAVLDADCARLEQIAMGIVEEAFSLALIPFPIRGAEKLQLASVIGMMAESTARYLASPHTATYEGVQLVADVADFFIGIGLGVGASTLAQQQGGRPPVVYRPPHTAHAKLWFDLDTRTHAIPSLPEGASAQTHGIFRKGEDAFVKLKTERGEDIVRIVADGAGYRIALDKGKAGPLVRPWRNGLWKLVATEQPLGKRQFAQLLLKEYTSDPATLERTRKLMRQFGLNEGDLIRMSNDGELLGATQIVMEAVGHAFIEEQVARLTDRKDRRWSAKEVLVTAPDIARYMERPLVVLDSSGQIETAVLRDGTAANPDRIPTDAVRVQRVGDRYLVPNAKAPADRIEHSSIFAAVEAATRPPTHQALDPIQREARFREGLAVHIAGRSRQTSLERMHEKWIAPLSLPQRLREPVMKVSRMRHVLRDKHHAATADQERRLLETVRDLMPEGHRIDIEVRRHGSNTLLARVESHDADATRIVIEADLDTSGRRVTYYRRDSRGEAIRSRAVEESFSPLIDAILNSGNGAVRRALKLGEYQWSDFADMLMTHMADDQDALLPPALGHLLVTNKDIRDQMNEQASDDLISGGHRYAQLSDLVGRTHIVEIGPTTADGMHEILDPHATGERGSGHFIMQRDGRWHRSSRLRHGYDPMDAAGRSAAASAIRRHLLDGGDVSDGAMDNLLDAIPQPLLREVAEHLDAADIDAGHGLVLTLRNPAGGTWTYRTMINTDGVHSRLAGRAETPPVTRPPTPGQSARHLTTAVRHTAGTLDETDTMVSSLIDKGERASRFIALTARDRHLDALMQARRLRGMLVEDEGAAVVASVSGHVFTLLIPASDIAKATEWSSIAHLPEGTRIVDSWYDVAADAQSYGERIRTVAQEQHERGDTIRQTSDDGIVQTVSPVEFTERVLSGRVRVETWNPRHDPISENGYIDYIRYRVNRPALRHHAGLDWITSDAARLDYLNYFTPPFAAAEPGAETTLASMTGLISEVRAFNQQNAPSSSRPADTTPPLPAISHSQAMADFHNWLRDDDATRPLLDDWEFDFDLLGD